MVPNDFLKQNPHVVETVAYSYTHDFIKLTNSYGDLS
jgi:hypothetical protein